MIKLGGKVYSIILEALKSQEVMLYNYKQVSSIERMLHSDVLALHHMGLKVTTPNVANREVIPKGIRRKTKKRPARASKGTNMVGVVVEEKVDE